MHTGNTTPIASFQNKGSGLIVLLHGGPGTGKTLAAESVAELVMAPLYRLTPGDIGTNPSETERSLDFAFYIGNIWKAGILLLARLANRSSDLLTL